MTLTETEYVEFLDTHLSLLLFIGQQKGIVASNTTRLNFKKMDIDIKFKCRERLFGNLDLLDEYVASNFDHLSASQIDIIEGFKGNVKSKFIVFKYLKNHAVFLDTKTNLFYATKALGDHFNVFFEVIPTVITTALIPFKSKIIYDGFLQKQGIHFGSNIKQTINEDYKKAKKENSIITQLDGFNRSTNLLVSK